MTFRNYLSKELFLIIILKLSLKLDLFVDLISAKYTIKLLISKMFYFGLEIETKVSA